MGILTLYHGLAVRTIITDLLDVAKVDIAEEDTVSPLPSPSSVIKSECNDILHVVRVLKRLYGGIQVVFI